MSTSLFIAGIHWLGTGLTAAAAAYACIALAASLRFPRARPDLDASAQTYPVSVLKPLHGAEPRLYQNLRGFCVQDHGPYQLVFGVRAPDDPAIAVVQRLRAEFPQLPIALVIDSRTHGSNPKVSNLINMLPHALHDRLVLADSDISVPVDYLARVTAALIEPDVGVVTCLYRGRPQNGLWSRLGCLFIDDWFIPSVRLAHAFGSTRFAFGSTIALRRDALVAIGGFEALKDVLADDFWLGELTRRQRLRTVLSDLVVGTDVVESQFSSLWLHELRWLRTIRAIAPVGFAMTWVCFTLPVVLLGLAMAPGLLNAALALLGSVARLLLHLLQRRREDERAPLADVVLIPLRDGLLLLEWLVALTGWRVQWRGEELHARGNGPAPHY
jgi:ceramide glucosyltransferase